MYYQYVSMYMQAEISMETGQLHMRARSKVCNCHTSTGAIDSICGCDVLYKQHIDAMLQQAGVLEAGGLC